MFPLRRARAHEQQDLCPTKCCIAQKNCQLIPCPIFWYRFRLGCKGVVFSSCVWGFTHRIHDFWNKLAAGNLNIFWPLYSDVGPTGWVWSRNRCRHWPWGIAAVLKIKWNATRSKQKFALVQVKLVPGFWRIPWSPLAHDRVERVLLISLPTGNYFVSAIILKVL